MLVLASACCGSPTGPDDDDSGLPARPVLQSPAAGAQLTSDTPTFTVQNARGFNSQDARYTFRLRTRSGAVEVAVLTVPAGRRATSATFAAPLPRGMDLTWNVSADSPTGQAASDTASFRTVAVDCQAARSPYAKAVVEVSIPACSLERNSYNDPEEVLGPPDAFRIGPGVFAGFLSLGEKGHVTVDMQLCAVDQPGPDIRVWQSVSLEPVTLYAGGSPQGPFFPLEARQPCGVRIPGGPFSGHCEFDLAVGEVNEARYLRVEDGEHFPCEMGQTDSEGADIDAVEVLNRRP